MFRTVLLSANMSTKYQNELQNIKDIFKSNLAVSREVVTYILKDMIDRLNEFLAQTYFEENIYFFNDVSEDIIENKNSFIELEGRSLYKKYKDNTILIESFSNMYTVVNNYSYILNDVNEEKELYNELKRYNYSLSYHNGMYHNWDGKDIESEIGIQINFDFDDYKKLNNEN